MARRPRPRPIPKMTLAQFEARFRASKPARATCKRADGRTAFIARVVAAQKCFRFARCRSSGSATPVHRTRDIGSL
jgi:hypothetical protein